MHDGAMADTHAFTDMTWDTLVAVDDAPVLHIGVIADGDHVAVSANGDIRPDGHSRSERDVSGDECERMNESGWMSSNHVTCHCRVWGKRTRGENWVNSSGLDRAVSYQT